MPSPDGGPSVGRAPTLYDVARAAGVSHQTVSRFLNGERLREANAERVRRAVADLDYRPNETARMLATNGALRIGALASDLNERSPQLVVNGASAAAQENGYILDIVSMDGGDHDSIIQSVNDLTRMRLAGMVVIAASDAMFEHVRSSQISCPVQFQRGEDATGGHPFARLVGHLADLGHRRVVHIAGPLEWRAARARTVGMRIKADECGVEVVAEETGDWSARSGYAAMDRLAQQVDLRGDGITGVIAANDSSALGAMFWLREHGFSIPGDLSVVGFDGVPDGEFFQPPLTTILEYPEVLGRELIHTLLGRIDPNFVVPEPRPSWRLLIRGSSGPARAV